MGGRPLILPQGQRPTAMRAWRAFALGIVLLGAASCTVSERFEDGHLSARSLSLGTMPPETCGPKSTRLRSATLGFGIARDGAVLGYRHADRACLPLDQCGVVVFAATEAEAEALRRLLPELETTCVITDASEKTKTTKG